METQTNGTLNVKSALELESKQLTKLTQTEPEMHIIAVITASLLLILTGWFYLKGPDAPAVEPTNLEVSTTNGV